MSLESAFHQTCDVDFWAQINPKTTIRKILHGRVRRPQYAHVVVMAGLLWWHVRHDDSKHVFVSFWVTSLMFWCCPETVLFRVGARRVMLQQSRRIQFTWTQFHATLPAQCLTSSGHRLWQSSCIYCVSVTYLAWNNMCACFLTFPGLDKPQCQMLTLFC